MQKPKDSINKLKNPNQIIRDEDREQLIKYIEDLEYMVQRLEEHQSMIYEHICEVIDK